MVSRYVLKRKGFMRLIGTSPSKESAGRFRDYLYGQGIEAQIDPGANQTWEIWVLDDDSLAVAASLWAEFQANPDDSRYVSGARAGSEQRRRERKKNVAKRYRTIDSSRVFYQPPVGLGGVTLTLMALSIGVAVVSRLGTVDAIRNTLSITAFGFQPWDWSLQEIRQGQVWRLITPIFLHFSILHILFNMLWLRDLGSVIEARRGSVRLLVLVLVLALTSNLAQHLHSGPRFGGMSGVVYGLLGYIWMQGKIFPAGALILRPQIVTMMMVWLVLCMTGLMGPIANTAHVVGLLVGVIWGALTAFWAKHH